MQRQVDGMDFFTGDFFEMLMIISFGIAWPTSIVKSIKSKTAKGKSLLFMSVVWAGYAFGIAAKLIDSNVTYVLVFYIINLCMVSVDIGLFFINRNRDRQTEFARNTDD